MSGRSYCTRRISPTDPTCGFQSGTRPLDDYFRRHALTNDQGDVGRAYVYESSPADHAAGLPAVIGFYTLSMGSLASQDAATVLAKRLPRYPMPVVLIGRLAVDERARGRRLGEALLLDALARAFEASSIVACVGVLVDAKDQSAEGFYAKYDFVTLDDAAWPRRMLLPMSVARAAFEDG